MRLQEQGTGVEAQLLLQGPNPAATFTFLLKRFKLLHPALFKASTMSGEGLSSGKTAEGRLQQRTGTLKRCASHGVPVLASNCHRAIYGLIEVGSSRRRGQQSRVLRINNKV